VRHDLLWEEEKKKKFSPQKAGLERYVMIDPSRLYTFPSFFFFNSTLKQTSLFYSLAPSLLSITYQMEKRKEKDANETFVPIISVLFVCL
jgi:hypothetical protein